MNQQILTLKKAMNIRITYDHFCWSFEKIITSLQILNMINIYQRIDFELRYQLQILSKKKYLAGAKLQRIDCFYYFGFPQHN